MSTYVYEVILDDEDDESGQLFEVQQAMADPPLTHHPTTGQPVRRVIQAPYLGGQHSTQSEKQKLTDANLAKQNFTKYVKTDQGKYKKVVGQGPGQISADS
jgi:predicted nucleic acid-binding Zn ribbon protein